MNDSHASAVVDDSVYHSLIDTPGGLQSPASYPAPHPASLKQVTFSIPEPDPLVLKDERSHQHAHQRLKKPDDISKAKRCVRCRYCRPWKWAGNAGRVKGGSRGFMEGEGECIAALDNSLGLEEEDTSARPAARTVTLADLVRAPRKGTEKQFEMVGRPRQVIILDEFTEVDSGKFDMEDWEHVDVEVKSCSVAFSYAKVVAGRV